MTISYPISIPDHADIEQFTMSPISYVAIAQSPFTGVQNVHRYPGQMWQADVKLTMLPRIAADFWTTFFLQLNGREGTFLMGDPMAGVPRGAARLSPLAAVYGGGQSGSTLVIISSANIGVSEFLAQGDYVQLGTEGAARLHRVLSAASTNSSGVCSLQLWPNLRSPPLDDQACIIQSCVGLWRLADNVMPWTEAPVIYSDIAFKAVEAL